MMKKVCFVNKDFQKRASSIIIEPGMTIYKLKKHLLYFFSKQSRYEITDLRLVDKDAQGDDDTLYNNYLEEKYRDYDAYKLFSNMTGQFIYYRTIRLKINVTVISKDEEISIDSPVSYENSFSNMIKKIEETIKIEKPFHFFARTTNLEPVSTDADIKNYLKDGLVLFLFPIVAEFINVENNKTKKAILKFNQPIKYYLFVKNYSKKLKITNTNIKIKIKDGTFFDIDVPIHTILKKQKEEPVIFEIHQEEDFSDKMNKKIKKMKKYKYQTNRDDEEHEIELEATAKVLTMKKEIAVEYEVDNLADIKIIFEETDLRNNVVLKDLNIGDDMLYVEFLEDVSDNDKDTKSYETIKLQKKIHQFEEILSINTSKSDDNKLKIIDEDEESEFHKNLVKIDEGATSITYKLIDTREKTPMCKKVIKYTKEQTAFKNAQNAMKEFEVMHSINHPCICKAIGINISEKIKIINEDNEEEEATTIAIFLEYVDYKLSDILNKKINNTSKTRIVLDIVHAMNFLHKKGMMHRDLKVDNIMINAFFETKLIDFGLVKISEIGIDGFSYVSDSLTRGIGTFAFMSPEMSNEEEYNNKTDVYSFGVILHFIFTGDLPKQSLKDKINGKKIDLPSPSKSISKFCIKLIDQCMSYSPSERPSFEEILNQMRENAYELASDVNIAILSRRDKELDFIENYK